MKTVQRFSQPDRIVGIQGQAANFPSNGYAQFFSLLPPERSRFPAAQTLFIMKSTIAPVFQTDVLGVLAPDFENGIYLRV